MRTAQERHLLDDLRDADRVYTADFEPLNRSGVEGFAVLSVDFGRRNTTEDDRLTVGIVATGLDEGLHLQHIHGFENGQDAVTPNRRDDTDRDRFIELLEGVPAYGEILLNLDNDRGKFPVTSERDGTIIFLETYHLPQDDDQHGSHAGDAITTFRNLDLNHLVIHGMRVPREAGEGTPGEVGTTEPRDSIAFDRDQYKEVLPVAVAEIEDVSFREARDLIRSVLNDGFDFG